MFNKVTNFSAIKALNRSFAKSWPVSKLSTLPVCEVNELFLNRRDQEGFSLGELNSQIPDASNLTLLEENQMPGF